MLCGDMSPEGTPTMHGPSERSCLLWFIKYPQKGRVKTRLAAALGDERAAELYRWCVIDLLATLQKSRLRFIVCVYPPSRKMRCRDWLGADHAYISQKGADLGERLQNGFSHAFSKGFQQVVAVGSDSPDLPGTFLQEAFSALRNADCVVGPASDGGYYLIGFNAAAFALNVFESMPWGTQSVLHKTLDALKKHKRSVHLLPEWHDIDTYEDVLSYMRRNQASGLSTSKTFLYLSRLDVLRK